MTNVDQRAILERLIQERREDYASLSRLIGRNSAYIQQFIRRGVPKRLSEGDRHTLARYFGIPEAELGGPGHDRGELSRASSTLIPVPRLNIDASAGPGAFNDSESGFAHIGFDEKWLRRVSRSKSSDLSVIKVQGDSMTPTLSDGDDILVDAGDGVERLRDGIYVLRRDDVLLVKRIAPSPASRRIIIKSDNDSYPSWPDCELGDVDIIGRVVWVACVDPLPHVPKMPKKERFAASDLNERLEVPIVIEA